MHSAWLSHPGLQVDAVGPDVDIAVRREIAPLPVLVLGLPFGREAGDDGRRQVRGVLAQQGGQRLLKVPRRDPAQVKDRRSWRKLHLGVDADTGQIVAAALTGREADDGAQVGPMLDQVAGPVASVTGDGAYDQDSVYASVAQRHPEAAIIVPPSSTAVPSKMAERESTQRDCHVQAIAAHGRMAWQKASGYNRRVRAETAVRRWKRVIGDGLRSHTDERRGTEVGVAVHVLNRMLELGRPTYVRLT
jgi:DDE family transposase